MTKVVILIVQLVLIITLFAGVNGDEWIIAQKTDLQFDGSGTPFYSCQYNFKVRCMWKVDGNRIKISDYGYTWKTGNGSNTYDCSIERKLKPPHRQKEEKLGYKVECLARATGLIKVKLGGSIELQCPVPDKSRCQWTRKEIPVTIDGSYTYTQDYDCSIRIDRIQPIDLTQWKCFGRTTVQFLSAIYTLAQVNTTVHTTVRSTVTDTGKKKITTTSTRQSERQNRFSSTSTEAETDEGPHSTLNKTEASPIDYSALNSSYETNTTINTATEVTETSSNITTMSLVRQKTSSFNLFNDIEWSPIVKTMSHRRVMQ